jgi:hypothetical protein
MENIWSNDYQNKQMRSIEYDRRGFKYRELLAELKRQTDVKLDKIRNGDIHCDSINNK